MKYLDFISDEAKRMEYYSELQKIVTEEAAIAPIFTSSGAIAMRSNVSGVQPYSISTHRFENIEVK